MDVVFDVELAGAGLDSVTGGAAQQGRMIGGPIELVELPGGATSTVQLWRPEA